MANRYMNQFYLSLEQSKCTLYAKVAIGATGAPTLNAAASKGVLSITRNDPGKYTLVFNDVWTKFYWMDAKVLLASGTPAVNDVAIVSEAVATVASKNIVVQFLDDTGAAADPDSGAVLYFKFELSNSNAP
jgi:hypothetical protein